MFPDFPDEYDPADYQVRPKKLGEARYAVGFQESPGEVGMVAGPYEELRKALEYYPPGRKLWFIFHCDQIYVIPLYRWRRGKDCWAKLRPKRVWAYHPESDCFMIIFKNELCDELVELGNAETYRREELRKIISDKTHLMYLYEKNEDIDDIPF